MRVHIIITMLLLSIAHEVTAARGAAPLHFDGSEAAQISIYVTDASGRTTINSYNEGQLMVPASVAKCLTSATALSLIGPDSIPFVTDVYLNGHIERDTTFCGEIVVEGAADPTMANPIFPDSPNLAGEIARALCERGIKRICGIISVHTPHGYHGPNISWEAEDIGEDYGAGLFGFNWRGNTFSFVPADGIVKTGQAEDIICRTIPRSGKNAVVRGIGSPYVSIYSRGEAPQRITTTMWNPAEFFIAELADSLDAAGIVREYAETEDAATPEILVRHISPSCKDILKEMMHRSDNLLAEGMLRAAGGLNMPVDSALAMQQRLWLGTHGFSKYQRMVDGSGLSRKDYLSARSLGGVLSAMLAKDHAAEYVSLFPRCGKDGTVKRFLKSTRLEGRMAVKSGSMGGVLCYAGYILAPDSVTPAYVAVVMVNNFICPISQVRTAIEKYLLSLKLL